MGAAWLAAGLMLVLVACTTGNGGATNEPTPDERFVAGMERSTTAVTDADLDALLDAGHAVCDGLDPLPGAPVDPVVSAELQVMTLDTFVASSADREVARVVTIDASLYLWRARSRASCRRARLLAGPAVRWPTGRGGAGDVEP